MHCTVSYTVKAATIWDALDFLLLCIYFKTILEKADNNALKYPTVYTHLRGIHVCVGVCTYDSC